MQPVDVDPADTATASQQRRRARTRLNENGRATQDKILLAAERLFAERGIDAVSTREITEAAGVNVASIHYHFGTRRDLVVALIERRAGYLGVRRDQYLDELEASGEVTLRAVVDALVRPTAELAKDPDGRSHAGFIVAVTNQPDLMPEVRRVFDRYTARYLEVLARVTPHLDDRTRRIRYGVARDIVNRVVGLPDGPLQHWVGEPDVAVSTEPSDELVAEVTDMVVAIFSPQG